MAFSSTLTQTCLTQLARFIPRIPTATDCTPRKSRRRLLHKERAALLQDQPLSDELREARFQTAALTEPWLDFNSDFYGFRADADKVVFYLGTVAGKGLPSAFLQTSCLSILRQAARHGEEPETVVRELNMMLSERGEENRYATLLYGILTPSLGTVRLVGAGHPAPIYLPSRGGSMLVALPRTLPVGLSKDAFFRESTLSLSPGDALVLFSEGVVSVRDADRVSKLGRAGLQARLETGSERSIATLLADTMLAVNSFGSSRVADQTLLGLRVLP